MTMWGFSSRKEQDGSTAATEVTNDDKQLSPSKRSRRRMGRRRGTGGDGNDKPGANDKPGSKKMPGPLNFSRPNGKQLLNNNDQALRTSRVMNQKETELSTGNGISHYEQQQDVNVDATDGQGIEILLDYKSSPAKGQHHSRRSMSNHKGRRSVPPEPQRMEQLQKHLSTRGSVSVAKVAPVVMSLEKDVLARRCKVYRAQFSVFFPIPTNSPSDPLAPKEQRRHRIPLGGRCASESLPYGNMVRMLQSTNPVDEITSVRTELKKTKAELDALEEDKDGLERRFLALNQQQLQSSPTGVRKGQLIAQQPVASGAIDGVDWDIHRLLSSNRKLGAKERTDLELKRGRSITVYLDNARSEEAFLNKCCGIKQAVTKKSKRKFPAVAVDPYNCRVGGAASTIRHLSLLPKGSSFFVSRDNGKSYSWGQLPPRLLQRMKSQGLDPVKHCGDLIYLSTGPNGYYFAEFRSGDCWWGCAGEDKEFYEILQKWEIYRVVFGASVTHTAVDGGNRRRDMVCNSWIILGRDGRAAWKNLPSRLHQTLEGRLANSAAPAEVSLGAGDSYYVRFLDGTIDYCLPAQLASVCDRIQTRGGIITDMALNPEVSHEFVVRHTEIS